jgi:hypothetical protein
MSQEVDGFYIRQARELIDELIKIGVINPEACTDKAKNAITDYIGYVTQTLAESAVKADKIAQELKAMKANS